MPVTKEIGSTVYGGTINHNGMLHIRTSTTASNSMLASISKLVEQAQEKRAPAQRFVNSVAEFDPMVRINTNRAVKLDHPDIHRPLSHPHAGTMVCSSGSS